MYLFTFHIYCRVPELVAWGKGLQERVHSPPPLPSDVGRDCLITNGSQDGLCKVIKASSLYSYTSFVVLPGLSRNES